MMYETAAAVPAAFMKDIKVQYSTLRGKRND